MSRSIFEVIEYEKKMPAKIFITSIEQSYFHWHFDYEFLLVLKGSIQMSGSEEMKILKAGDMILFNSKVIHSLWKTDEENIILFIQLKKSMFDNWKDKNRNYNFYLDSASFKIKTKIPYSCFAETAARIGIAACSEDMHHFYRLQALIYTFVADLFEYAEYNITQLSSTSSFQAVPEIFIKIIEYIELNYQDDCIEESICKIVEMSDKTLYRFLKRHAGLTVKDLLMATRIEEAKKLLKFSEKSISCIGAECGFSNENTFHRCFKKEMGVTPNEYRLHGSDMSRNPKIGGYMDFNAREAMDLLRKYLYYH